MKLLSYDQMKIEVVKADLKPSYITKLACDHTMLKNLDLSNGAEAGAQLLQFLVKAEHASVLEHCSITFAIGGVSRSLLAQLSRQRMSSITSQSQHYQDYSKAPMVNKTTTPGKGIEWAMENSLAAYKKALANGLSHEEARQVLPNAASVNILWTVNARSLMLFLRHRMCKRNIEEMQIFADRIHKLCVIWWPELFTLIGPHCFMDGECNQGIMKAEACK